MMGFVISVFCIPIGGMVIASFGHGFSHAATVQFFLSACVEFACVSSQGVIRQIRYHYKR